MAAIPPVEIDPHEWLLLRNLSYEEFKFFLTDCEDIGVTMARRRLRLKYANQFPATGAKHAD
jgi:hypothetical protein